MLTIHWLAGNHADGEKEHGYVTFAEERFSKGTPERHPCPKSDLGTKHVHACSGVCVT